jgi:pimeloyl-ACP methyl ester carboxylesterase
MNWVNRGLLKLGERFQTLGGLSIRAVATIWRSVPGAAQLWFATLLPPADIDIVKRPEVGVILARNIQESLRQGVQGAVTEFQLLLSDWRPLLQDVRVPTTIWHGTEDTYVPISMARVVHKGISGSTFHEVKGGGHFMIVDRLKTVLELFA